MNGLLEKYIYTKIDSFALVVVVFFSIGEGGSGTG